MTNYWKLYMLVFVASLFMASCSKDDTLKGEWQATRLVATNCDDPDDNVNLSFTNGCTQEVEDGVSVEICYTASFTDTDFTFSFRFEVLGQSFTETERGTYTINGNNVRLCFNDGDCADGTVNRNRNELVVNDVDESDNCRTSFTLRKR